MCTGRCIMHSILTAQYCFFVKSDISRSSSPLYPLYCCLSWLLKLFMAHVHLHFITICTILSQQTLSAERKAEASHRDPGLASVWVSPVSQSWLSWQHHESLVFSFFPSMHAFLQKQVEILTVCLSQSATTCPLSYSTRERTFCFKMPLNLKSQTYNITSLQIKKINGITQYLPLWGGEDRTDW